MQNLNYIKTKYNNLLKKNKTLRLLNLILFITLLIISYEFIIKPYQTIPHFTDKQNEIIMLEEIIPTEVLEADIEQ